METPQIKQMAVKEITIAPLIKDQPRWPESEPRFQSFVKDVRERGIQEPLRVDENGVLWDGFDRLRAAKRLRLTEVPVLPCKSTEGPDIAFGSFVQRKHATKGQRVYAAYPYFAAKHAAAKERAQAIRQSGGKIIDTAASESVDAMATELGVSPDLFQQAARLHEMFKANPDLKGEFEPKIMCDDDPISLGAAIAGIKGKQATDGKARNPSRGGRIGLFRDALIGVSGRLKYYERFTDEEKAEATAVVQRTVSMMPPDLRGEFRRAIARAEKEQRAQGIEAAA